MVFAQHSWAMQRSLQDANESLVCAQRLHLAGCAALNGVQQLCVRQVNGVLPNCLVI